MINKVTLLGNLGQDPEFRTLESGIPVCRLSVATNKNYKDAAGEWNQVSQWHNVILWREAAERAEKSLKKGDLVYIEGELSYRSTEKEGIKRYYTDINSKSFRRLTKRDYTADNIPGEEPPQHVHANTPPEGSTPEATDDDLPF